MARGDAKIPAFLDDYACVANSLVSLYEADFDERYIDEAIVLADAMLAQFFDSAAGGFFYTAADQQRSSSRQKDWQDSSTPSGNAMAATALLRLGKLTGRGDYLDAAVRTLQAAAGLMERFPSAAGQMLAALDFHLGPTPEIVVVGRTDDADTAALDSAGSARAGGYVFRTKSSLGGRPSGSAVSIWSARSNRFSPVKRLPPNRPSTSARTSPARRRSSASPRRWKPLRNSPARSRSGICKNSEPSWRHPNFYKFGYGRRPTPIGVEAISRWLRPRGRYHRARVTPSAIASWKDARTRGSATPSGVERIGAIALQGYRPMASTPG